MALLEAGGSLLEKVAGGGGGGSSPFSLLLAASALALSVGYLFQLGSRAMANRARTGQVGATIGEWAGLASVSTRGCCCA